MIMGPLALPSGRKVHVSCSGGWLGWLRREDGTENFNRTWADYTRGFGKIRGEHWLGLETIHLLTTALPYELQVEITSFDNKQEVAKYSTFEVASAVDQYRLTVKGYDSKSSTAGDSLSSGAQQPHGMAFSATDMDNDKSVSNCATSWGGGWWHNACFVTFPTGKYCQRRSAQHGCMIWSSVSGGYPLKSLTFKMRPNWKGKVIHIGECFGTSPVNHNGYAMFAGGVDKKVSCADGWLVWLRREGGLENFNRSWTDYMEGFGNPAKEYWMGLEALYLLTKKYSNFKDYRFRVELTGHDGRTFHAVYARFIVSEEFHDYKAVIYDYLTNESNIDDNLMKSPDSMMRQKFSTPDKDQDLSSENCALKHGGGWWFNKCGEVNPTGVLMTKHTIGDDTVYWKGAYGDRRALKRLQLKIRPEDP